MTDELPTVTELVTAKLEPLLPVPIIPQESDSPKETEAAVVEAEVVAAPTPPFYRRRIPLPIAIAALCFFLTLSMTVTVFVLPFVFPSATIIITPAVKSLSETMQTAAPDSRQLAAISLSLAQTAPTTGTTHQSASEAHGVATFYNAAPYPQTIVAGVLLMASGGVEAVTDDTIIVPAGNFSINGSQSVTAHTLESGSSQNIPANGIDGPCCFDNIFVRNNTSFAGGMDARTFRSVARRDVNALVSGFASKLLGQETMQFRSETLPGENITTPLCSLTVHASPPIGAKAVAVNVSVKKNLFRVDPKKMEG